MNCLAGANLEICRFFNDGFKVFRDYGAIKIFEKNIKIMLDSFHRVVPFNPVKDKLYLFDFTDKNKELSAGQIADTESFATILMQIARAKLQIRELAATE